MFRLLKSGLPKDPVFPADLEGLGYFINDRDEVRMISNPRAYFNFFLTKNDRHNAVQREAMNCCLRVEILKRLHDIGMKTVLLPLGTKETEPHIPILVSSNISAKKCVIILFYEHTQDLGVFAYRIVGGRGGINAGSAVNFVKYVQSLSGPNGEDSPGVILANLGQLRWWRRGKKAVTHTSWFSLPQKSAVSGAYRFDVLKNTVQENRNTAEHVAYIFNHVVPALLAPDAILEVIGVSVGAVEVVDFLDKPQNWAIMEPRLTALALVSTFHRKDDICNPWFADWLRKRGRAYIISNQPASTPLASPTGNSYTDPDDNTTTISDDYGCPVYSLGEPYYSELMLPKGYKMVLNWFQEVVASGEEYENPEVIIKKNVQTEDKTVVETKWNQPEAAEVRAGRLKSEEQKGEEVEVDIAQADETEVERVRKTAPKVEEPNFAAAANNGPYIQGIEEAEYKSRMDWSEEVWEEEMKKYGVITEVRVIPENKEERAKEPLSHEGDTSIHTLNFKGQKAEQSNLRNSNIASLREYGSKEEVSPEKSTKAHDLEAFGPSYEEKVLEKTDLCREQTPNAAPEDTKRIYGSTMSETLMSEGFTDHDFKQYIAKQESQKEEDSKSQDISAEHANTNEHN